MRWTRLIPALAVALPAVACDQDAPTALDPPQLSMHAPGAPVEFTVGPFSFIDANPCTGEDHTITVMGTGWFHDHGDQLVIRTKRTVTTEPTGFVGRGTTTEVVLLNNAGLYKLKLNDMLKNPSGAQIRARFTQLVDISTDPPTVRVAKGTVTCVRS